MSFKSQTLSVRFPGKTIRAIDVANEVSAHFDTRADLIREAVRHYIESHEDVRMAVAKDREIYTQAEET